MLSYANFVERQPCFAVSRSNAMPLHFRFPLILLFLCSFIPPAARAQDVDCLKCHAGLKKGKAVHAPVEMCVSCHSGIDAKTVPHRKTTSIAKGLSAEQPELCYGCHDKALFSKKVVHAPVAGGMCLTCHTPHSSGEMALLVKQPYELCLDCHGDIPAKPHAISGFGAGRHPLGE